MRVALLTVLPISDHLPVYVELKLKLPKEGGVRVCGIGLFLVRCCGNFYFKVRYCGFKSASGLR